MNSARGTVAAHTAIQNPDINNHKLAGSTDGMVRHACFIFMITAGLLMSLLTPGGVALAAEAPLYVAAGEQRLLSYPKAVTRVAIGAPDTANVVAQGVPRRQLLLTGKQPGSTSLKVWLTGSDAPREYKVIVTAAGMRDDAAQATDAGGAASAAQVQVDIRVVEVSRRALKAVGVNLLRNGPNETTVSVSPPGVLSSVNAFPVSGASEAGFVPFNDAFNLVVGNNNSGMLGVLSALEGSGFAYVLAEPSLVALSGQTASFLAGGEFPIPVDSGNESVTIEFRQFGVRLRLTPTILSEDRIMMKVAPEVSELDFNAGIRFGGIAVPALRVRRTDTSIQLGDGESFVISGLISQNTLTSVDKVPFLGDLPILGAFFRSSRFDREDKELIMVATPHLVHPIKRGARLPEPPGEAYRQYNPKMSDFWFNEIGDFGAEGLHNTGFSD